MFKLNSPNNLEKEYNNLQESLIKELAQEEYMIKWDIYALTKHLDVMNMTLKGALMFKLHEDIKYQNYKKSKYDSASGLPRNSSEINLINLFFEYECLNQNNKLEEVISSLDKMMAFYDDRSFLLIVCSAFFMQNLHKKPGNQKLTELMVSVRNWSRNKKGNVV